MVVTTRWSSHYRYWFQDCISRAAFILDLILQVHLLQDLSVEKTKALCRAMSTVLIKMKYILLVVELKQKGEMNLTLTVSKA